MIFIILGASGFFLLFLFEIIALKNIPLLKPIIWLASNAILISAVICMTLSQDKLVLPVWTMYLGWILLAPAVIFKIYSLLISLPLRRSYISRGVSGTLVTTGLYSLVRYPWVLSLLLILIALFLISGSRLLLTATPILFILNLLLAIIQDRFFYDKMFTGYATYRKQTPMLIPNRQSLGTFIKGIRPGMSMFSVRRSK